MRAYDLLVVGGGVQGLWLARAAIARGLRVALVEADTCGSGASGGLLGALMPHVPTGWSEKKQFQFEGLISLEEQAEKLRQETGVDTGYNRCGRIMPIRLQGFRDQFPSRRAGSWLHWRARSKRFELGMLDADAFPDWLDPDQAELGIFWDPLAARINPEQYIAALKTSVTAHCDIYENWPFAEFDVATNRVTSRDEQASLIAERVILAAGFETFALVNQMIGLDLGSGVKGQAILLQAELPTERPIIFDDGMYVVSHTQNYCAVGSTTEKAWDDARSTDDALDSKLEQARRLCPALRDAQVVSAWAGVRPQSGARDPIAGQLLPDQPIYIATGGFKITLGIAHIVAKRLIDSICDGRPASFPATFEPALHIAKAQERAAR